MFWGAVIIVILFIGGIFMQKENKNKYIFSMLFFFALVGLTFYFLLKDCDFRQLGTAVLDANYIYLFLSVFMVVIYIACEGKCLKIIVESLKGKMNYFSGFTYSCIDFYFCAVTPSATGGQPVAAYYMVKDGISVSTSAIALLLNTIQYKLVLIVLGVLVILFKGEFVIGSNIAFTIMFTFGIIANIITIVVCFVAIFSKTLLHKMVVFCVNFLSKIKIIKNKEHSIKKFENHFADYGNSAEYLKKNPWVTLKVFFFSFIQRTAMFSVAYFVYKSFGLNSSSFFDLLAIQVAVAMAVDSLPLPGGVGASEAFLAGLYVSVYGGHGMVATATLLTRGISYYFCLLLSGGFSIANHIKHIKLSNRLRKENIR